MVCVFHEARLLDGVTVQASALVATLFHRDWQVAVLLDVLLPVLFANEAGSPQLWHLLHFYFGLVDDVHADIHPTVFLLLIH